VARAAVPAIAFVSFRAKRRIPDPVLLPAREGLLSIVWSPFPLGKGLGVRFVSEDDACRWIGNTLAEFKEGSARGPSPSLACRALANALDPRVARYSL
jgi:hypothetical protein